MQLFNEQTSNSKNAILNKQALVECIVTDNYLQIFLIYYILSCRFLKKFLICEVLLIMLMSNNLYLATLFANSMLIKSN